MPEPSLSSGYADRLDPERRANAEERIAAAIYRCQGQYAPSTEYLSSDDCTQLGRDLLRLVLREFRPDLFADAARLPDPTPCPAGQEDHLERTYAVSYSAVVSVNGHYFYPREKLLLALAELYLERVNLESPAEIARDDSFSAVLLEPSAGDRPATQE